MIQVVRTYRSLTDSDFFSSFVREAEHCRHTTNTPPPLKNNYHYYPNECAQYPDGKIHGEQPITIAGLDIDI